jgi:hypothetical protein
VGTNEQRLTIEIVSLAESTVRIGVCNPDLDYYFCRASTNLQRLKRWRRKL